MGNVKVSVPQVQVEASDGGAVVDVPIEIDNPEGVAGLDFFTGPAGLAVDRWPPRSLSRNGLSGSA